MAQRNNSINRPPGTCGACQTWLLRKMIRVRRLLLLLVLALPLNGCSSSKPADGLGVYPKAEGAADEMSAIQSLRTIASAEMQWKTTNGTYGNFDELIQAGFLDERFAGATPTVRGYAFSI